MNSSSDGSPARSAVDAQKGDDRFPDVCRRSVAFSLRGGQRTLEVGIDRQGRQGRLRAGAAGNEAVDLDESLTPAEFLAELDVPARSGQVDLVAQVMKHVHDCHAGAGIGHIGRELVARDAAHVQIGQPAFERIADFDAGGPKRRVQEDQHPACRSIHADLPLAKDLLGLFFDRRARDVLCHHVNVDAEVLIEIVGHSPEASAERRKNARRIVDARMRRLGRIGKRFGWRLRGNDGAKRRKSMPGRRSGDEQEDNHQGNQAARHGRNLASTRFRGRNRITMGARNQASSPPSIGIAAPFTCAAASDAR